MSGLMVSGLTLVLLEHLVRKGVLDATDLEEMAGRLESFGAVSDAHLCLAVLKRANADPDDEAAERRPKLHIVP